MAATPQHLHNRGFRALIGTDRWNALLAHGNRRSFPAAERLLDQGAPSRLVHVLIKGRIRVVYTEDGGNEVLMAIRGPGDLLGEYAQRDRGRHMATVWSLDGCETAVLTAAAFDDAVRHLRASDALQQYILQKYRQIPQRLWHIANLQTEQRMALLFVEIIGADPGPRANTIPMTQQLIADSLGVARSSVTRYLSEWRRAGILRSDQTRLEVIDSAALARRANRS